jgi:magnesium-transporting ATPase (P-type)
MVLFVLVVNISFHRPLLESVMFAAALAVGLTPELLPMIVTVTLARSALQLSKRRGIVKRLSAIHDLGASDMLCTDKTGTLTEATIKLVCCIDGHGAENANVHTRACINSHFESGMKSPLDEAILVAHPFDMSGWRKIDEVPFDFERRRVSVLAEHDGRRRLIVKGAPEDVLRLAGQYEKDGQAVPLDAATRQAFMLVFGPVSSVFDFFTFYAMLHLFGAGAALFQTGWFIESMVTQFCLRTRRVAWRSRPVRLLVGMSVGAVVLATVLSLLPVGRWFGFVPPPPVFFAYLITATPAYLALVEVAKMPFYRMITRSPPGVWPPT